eukprot:TRINITY_DN30667_c0_g1_i1.p1 TRINITY_DN30667_c0_g1~~TRINITY_DN30667_c0_g1_i1.p1  ORF type:complete len:509 (+),score=90.98 TRINITY_DN30667_c0_g1_i1:43-1569(+)
MTASVLAAVLLLTAVQRAAAQRLPLRAHRSRSQAGNTAKPLRRQRGVARRGERVTGHFDGIVYCVDVWLGGQHQRVQFDTGSSDLAVASTLCGDCPPASLPAYDPFVTGERVSCSSALCRSLWHKCGTGDVCAFTDKFVDQSGFTADMFLDSVSFTNTSEEVRTVVSAFSEAHPGTDQSRFEPALCNGIMGAAFRSIATTKHDSAVFSYLKRSGGGLFSVCFTGGGGGTVALGEVLPHSGAVWFQNLLQGDDHLGMMGFWSVGLLDISVAGKSLGVQLFQPGGPPCIVDTGTTEVVLPSYIFNEFQRALSAHCSGLPGVACPDRVSSGETLVNGYCVEMTDDQRARFPNVSFHFESLMVTVPGSAYLSAELCESPGSYALAISGMDGAGTILGLAMLRGLTTIFDVDRLRVGFASVSSSGCPPVPPVESEGPSRGSSAAWMAPPQAPIPAHVGPNPPGWKPPTGSAYSFSGLLAPILICCAVPAIVIWHSGNDPGADRRNSETQYGTV